MAEGPVPSQTPSPAITALRAELAAAIALLDPQIRGMEDLAQVSMTEETLSFVRRDFVNYSRRRTLCLAVVSALDALEADGFPDVLLDHLPADNYAELQEQRADLLAAIGQFDQALAAKIDAELGEPTDKPVS
ncbi:hypothetical protein UFOVP1244_66 [uncultured Caudovirales phage]|uniref:Uncharacterized protein n=1 Tax=uncultured Caudovirales phage TaxID=2100421 RepID=A0A6J5RE09_9CAUD|nr:hypothetical protein UFOVP1244_66 [uncultured Caudovirales phage]